jgi:hypothetical protein
MKKVMILLIIVSFIFTIGFTLAENETNNSSVNVTITCTTETLCEEGYTTNVTGEDDSGCPTIECIRGEIKENKPRQIKRDNPSNNSRKAIQVQQVVRIKNRLHHMIQEANGTCPDNCTCTGSAIKCATADGNREMIIRTGKSGNTIVQVKNSNMSTMVSLFKSEDGEVFGVFKGNQTKKIVLPDKASEVAKQRIQQRIKEKHRNQKRIMLEDEEIELNEEGYYEAKAKKKARLFWIIPVKEHVNTQIDAETGVVVKQKHSWWGFLARDVREEVEPAE